jgi:Na+/H+ antiporter NhaD/arsenite permease-like protein
MLRFVSSYRSLIIVIYLLTFVLSLIIPMPGSALLIMSVMLVVIDTAQIGCRMQGRSALRFLHLRSPSP